MSVLLAEIAAFCDHATNRWEIRDFPGAVNGLQVANSGTVRKIGAAVDAGQAAFDLAAGAQVDFLIVHHGLYWTPPVPLVDAAYRKVASLFRHDMALYSSHLPLDAHPQLGNNALLAQALGMTVVAGFAEYEKTKIGAMAEASIPREELYRRLIRLFPRMTALEFGPVYLDRVAILTGSGSSAVSELAKNGLSTLITGELKQQHFNQAQEEGWNLYLCGHYATETFGVKALAAHAANHFGLPWTFLDTGCPL